MFACMHTFIIWMYMYVYECITLYMYVYACIHVYMHVSVCISDCGPLSRVSQARAGISGAGLKMAMLHTSLCHHLIPKISLPQAAIGIVTRLKRQVGAWQTVCAAAFGVARDNVELPSNQNQALVEKHCSGRNQAPLPSVPRPCCLRCSTVPHPGEIASCSRW